MSEAVTQNGGEHVAVNGDEKKALSSLYVGNLPFSTRWTELKDLFKEAGDVAFADIPKNFQNGRSRGYGVVQFNSAEDAQKAIEMFNGYSLNGRALVVREDQFESRGSSAPGGGPGGPGGGFGGQRQSSKFQVFVGNLPWTTTWQDLKDFAKDQGLEPTRADVQYGHDGRSRGWGTLGFASEEECQNAIVTLNGLDVNGRAVEVREDRKQSGRV